MQARQKIVDHPRARPDRWVRFRYDEAAAIARSFGHVLMQEQAAFFGVSPAAYSRVIRGLKRPGEDFIASVLAAQPGITFDAMFELTGPAAPASRT